MVETMELIAVRDGETTRLVCPGVGFFTCAAGPGALLGPGQDAGVLFAAGRRVTLVTPARVAGRVTNERFERVQEPVAYGMTLYELAPLAEGSGVEEDQAVEGAANGLVLRATQTGRFYRRPAPDEPDYVEVGGEVQVGSAIGLIEIMKTFNQVTYEARDGLPRTGRLARWLCEDGAEVREGDPLLEVEGRSD